MEPKLNPVPSAEWQAKYDELMKDPYLSKKYNRNKRIKDHKEYIKKCTPEITRCIGRTVLEIGPGMGEWLELCSMYGHDGIGIESELNESEMGNEYSQMIKLMAERQNLNINFVGFVNYLYSEDKFIEPGSIFYINIRGSIEQCFKDYMTGIPHKITKNAHGLKWNITTELWDLWDKMVAEFDRILEVGGFIYCWANGSQNNPEYDNLWLETLKKYPKLKLFKKEGKLQHKIRKVL